MGIFGEQESAKRMYWPFQVHFLCMNNSLGSSKRKLSCRLLQSQTGNWVLPWVACTHKAKNGCQTNYDWNGVISKFPRMNLENGNLKNDPVIISFCWQQNALLTPKWTKQVRPYSANMRPRTSSSRVKKAVVLHLANVLQMLAPPWQWRVWPGTTWNHAP